MGLFDFVKDAGERIFGKDRDAAADDAQKAAALRNVITGVGLDVSKVDIAYADGVVTLEGSAPSQEDREKMVLIAGNTQGVSQVDDRLTVEQPTPEAIFYTVKSGDTLSKIAKTHLGDAMKYPQIFEANRPMLSDPDKIYPGQVLRIPQ
jgi:nucleoid-associated protein YgaU